MEYCSLCNLTSSVERWEINKFKDVSSPQPLLLMAEQTDIYIQGMDKNMETPYEMRAWIEVFILAMFVGDAVLSAQYHYL